MPVANVAGKVQRKAIESGGHAVHRGHGATLAKGQKFSGGAAASFLAVEQRPPRRDKLEQNIVVADIRDQHGQAEFPGLQEQYAILERAQLAVFPVASEAAQDSR
jgi:hypothetical protein